MLEIVKREAIGISMDVRTNLVPWGRKISPGRLGLHRVTGGVCELSSGRYFRRALVSIGRLESVAKKPEDGSLPAGG